MKRRLRATQSGCVRLAVAALCIAFTTFPGCRTELRPTLTLSAAASLQDAIVEIEASYKREAGQREAGQRVDFRNNFGPSGTLAREIENGAPVDAIIAAGEKPVDDLQAKGMRVP